MTDTALAVEQPLRRVVPLVDLQAAAPEPPERTPEPPERTPEPAPAHDRSRPTHCRIAMQFED
ncbi:hypothetical protein [Kitasatospora sp. NPDC093102]|uniref:hypothetical protein n=1 Tax=Kitasatospora sp. NPDC093102 TaxID=3155069 RepID=UPI00341A0E0A